MAQDWCKQWQMQMNYEKTAAITITCKKKPGNFSYRLNGKTGELILVFGPHSEQFFKLK